MGDTSGCPWYESMSRTPIRDDVRPPLACLNSTAPALVVPAPPLVIGTKMTLRGFDSDAIS